MNEIKKISDILLNIKSQNDIYNFLTEILTDSEVETLSKRWRILSMLNDGKTQREISKELQVSLCKVTRGSRILKNKNSVIKKYLDGEKKNDKSK